MYRAYTSAPPNATMASDTASVDDEQQFNTRRLASTTEVMESNVEANIAITSAVNSRPVPTFAKRLISDDLSGRFTPKTAYHGIVTKINRKGGQFYARIQRMEGFVADDQLDEIDDADLEFPIEALPDGYEKALKLGAAFIWMTGYDEGIGRPRQWVSRLRFRKLPSRSDAETMNLSAGYGDYSALFSSASPSGNEYYWSN